MTDLRTGIWYVKGDATYPQGEGMKVIVHCCNDAGGWGSGFVLALNKRWSKPREAYRRMEDRPLGHVDLVRVEDDIWVANLIGQHSMIQDGEPRPIRYDAIYDGLESLVLRLGSTAFSIHMPRMGAGLARGKWSIIEAIINETLVERGFLVTVYDLP